MQHFYCHILLKASHAQLLQVAFFHIDLNYYYFIINTFIRLHNMTPMSITSHTSMDRTHLCNYCREHELISESWTAASPWSSVIESLPASIQGLFVWLGSDLLISLGRMALHPLKSK